MESAIPGSGEAGFSNPYSLPLISLILASCSSLFIGLFFFGRDAAAVAGGATVRGGVSLG